MGRATLVHDLDGEPLFRRIALLRGTRPRSRGRSARDGLGEGAQAHPEAIAATTAKRLGKGFRLMAPFLTSDRSVDRIVWAVPARREGGEARTVYVAGEYAYVARG